MKKKLFIVLQIGARHNYQIPLYFANKKSLAAFYTDFHSSHLIFWIFQFIPRNFLVKKLNRISNRKLPYELPNKLVKDNLFNIFFRSQKEIFKDIFKRIKSANFANANSIYTNVINDDIELVIEAKKKGIYIVHEVIINPNINQIYLREIKRFPTLKSNKNENDSNKIKDDKDLLKLNLADRILVPSEYIYKELIKKGLSKKKINIFTPYMPNREFLKIQTYPKKGRILFVGQISIMKGIHYFAEVCRILKRKNFHYEFIAAGKHFIDIKNPLLNGPRYLGNLPRQDLMKVYSTSDLFVLPSLSDSFPIAPIEAMSCGIPVILTTSCGSIVEDGKNGYLIKPGDSSILANKIIEIVENRSLRNKLGHNARLKVQDYKISDFYNNLDKALN